MSTTIGHWLRSMRKASRATLIEAGILCDYSDAYLSMVETGQRAAPQAVIDAYLAAYGEHAGPQPSGPVQIRKRRATAAAISEERVRQMLSELRGASA